MAKASFDLVILNHTSCKSIENLVQELLVILDKVGDPYLEYKLSEALLFEQNSSAILDNISQEVGETYQEKFRELDVETELRPTLQLVARETADTNDNVEQHTCPACQHMQPKQKIADAMNTCERCGVVGEKYKKNERKEEVYQLEKRKLEQAQNRQMQNAFERAKHDEEEEMRNEARQKLGLKKKRNYGTALAGLGIVAVVGATVYFIFDKMNSGASVTAEQAVDLAKENSTEDESTNQTSAKNGTESTNESATEQATSGNAKDATKQQSMVTIQGGGGSIVVNNNAPNNANDTGKGGSKGSTAGEATTTISNSNNESTDLQQQASTPTNTSNITTNTNEVAGTNQANNSQQLAAQTQTQTTSANQSNTQQQANVQLAAVSPTQQNKTSTQSAVITSSTKPVASNTAAQKPKILKDVSAPANDIKQLKDILQGKYKQSKQFFNRLNQQQFTDHQQRLNRLLALDKPDLALIFAEGIDDPYLASLLILEVGKYAKKKNNNELNDAILLGMKAQVVKGNSIANNAMLNASLSQAYDFAGDRNSAQEILKQSIQMLNHEDISIAQSCKLLAQIDQNHRQFGNQNGADFMAGALIEFANKLPAKDYRYRSEIYTHLAATALHDGKKEDATEWLKHIPVQNAQHELLSEMETLLAKNKFSKTE